MMPLCQYHQQHHKPTHCRQCGKELPNCRLWYCGGAEGECVKLYYSLNVWGYAVELAIKRAGRKCEDCSSSLTLEVHHIKPLNGSPRRGELNKQGNLRVLCHACHIKAHVKLRPRKENKDVVFKLSKFEKAIKRGQLVFDVLLTTS